MSRYFRLVGAINTRTTLNIAHNDNGKTAYTHIQLEPGIKYDLQEDELFIRSLRSAKIEKRYSDQLVKELNDLEINYTEHYCRSCGGKAKRVSYSAIEIIDA